MGEEQVENHCPTRTWTRNIRYLNHMRQWQTHRSGLSLLERYNVRCGLEKTHHLIIYFLILKDRTYMRLNDYHM